LKGSIYRSGIQTETEGRKKESLLPQATLDGAIPNSHQHRSNTKLSSWGFAGMHHFPSFGGDEIPLDDPTRRRQVFPIAEDREARREAAFTIKLLLGNSST